MFAFIDNPRWDNVDAVIEGLVTNLPNPGTERERLIAHALSVVQPGFSYFHQKFTIDLAHEMQLLKYAQLCNPVRIREIRPTPQQLDELPIFKCISVPQPLVCLSGLKRELTIFLALAQDLHAEYFQMNDILSFFCAHQRELPTWSYFACVLATQRANSASVERVFSILKQTFKEMQEKSQAILLTELS